MVCTLEVGAELYLWLLSRKESGLYQRSSEVSVSLTVCHYYYDMILCGRWKRWCSPHREQVAFQSERGCQEHIISLRLLTDNGGRKCLTLFVLYVDFTKPYNLVPRRVLFEVLKRLGCGLVILSALVAMYRVTKNINGLAVMTATIGVRRDSPTSCFLFIVLMNDMIKHIKEKFQPDFFFFCDGCTCWF